MASTQELIFKISADSGNLKSTMAQIRSELSQIAQVQETANKNERQRSASLITVWKTNTQAAITEERKRVQAILQEEKQLAAQMIREARAVQAVRGQINQTAISEERQLAAQMIREARVAQATRSQLNKTAEREERQLAATMIREGRAAQSGRTQAERQAFAEMRRMERERRQIMADNARAIGAIARNEADVRIREGRRAASAAVASLKASGGGGDFAAALGFGGGVAGGVTALVGASAVSELRAGAVAWVNYASKLESTKIAFTTMLGSAQRATSHLKELQSFALKTPFQFEELIDASQRMQALGFEAEQVIPVLTDVGNAVAAAGGGQERLDRVVLALSQMQSKGRVMTQELNQLAESGIPAWRIMEVQLGRSRAELVKMVEQGEISSAVFLEAFQKFSQQNFGGLMEKQAKTFTGALSNIKDASLALTTTALAPLFDLLTKSTLEAGRFALSLNEGAQGAAILLVQLSKFPGLLDAIKLSAAFPGLLDAIKLASQGLALLGTPEITAPNVPEVKPVPLPAAEGQALIEGAERASALRAESEEAKRIATDRIADQERAFRLGKITREQETEDIVAQLQVRAHAEQRALDQEIIRKTNELLANKDNAEKVAQIVETIGTLQQQIRNNQSALDREIADKRAALQLQERQNLLEHQQARLAILLQTGHTEIQAIEAEVTAGVKSREEGNKKVEEIESSGFDARLRLLKLELAQVGIEPAERQKVINKIDALDAERTANAQKQAARRREVSVQEARDFLSLNVQLAAIQEAMREGALARTRRDLGRLAIPESVAISRELKVIKEAHEERLILLNIELEAETTSAARKTELINDKIELEQRYTDEVERLTQERIDAQLREAEESSKAPGFRPEREVELEPDEVGLGRRLEDVLGPPPDLTPWVQLKAAIAAVSEEMLTFSEFSGAAVKNALLGIGDAVRQSVAAWALYGESITKAFRKALAGVLASIAAEAAIQALMHVAYAIGKAALGDFGGAAKHAIAAAKFAAVAAAAGIGARIVAGNEFSGKGGAGDKGSSDRARPTQTQTEPTPFEKDRRTASIQSQPIVQTIEFRVKGGVVVDEFSQDYLLNGRTRFLIKSDGQG